MELKDNPKTEGVSGAGGLYVKVMTDEQMELLRRQISVYSTICEKLAEMHKAISAQHDLSGLSLLLFTSNFFCFNNEWSKPKKLVSLFFSCVFHNFIDIVT